MDLFRISDLFDAVSGSDTSAGRGTKTAILAHALKLVSVNRADRPVMIGDRCYDVEAAHANNIDSIGVSHGYGSVEELREAGATYVVDSVDTLRKILQQRDE